MYLQSINHNPMLASHRVAYLLLGLGNVTHAPSQPKLGIRFFGISRQLSALYTNYHYANYSKGTLSRDPRDVKLSTATMSCDPAPAENPNAVPSDDLDLAALPFPELTWMPATSTPTPRGSFLQDQASGRWSLCWESWQDFQQWLRSEQHEKSIELVRKNLRKATPGLGWLEWHEYVCARQGSGGIKKHMRKDPERTCNIPTK
jgi:hypothetical protein